MAKMEMASLPDEFDQYAVHGRAPAIGSAAENDGFEQYAVNRPSVQSVQSPQENIASSVFKAPFRVGEDILKGAQHLAQKTPALYQAGKEEAAAIPSTIAEHPAHYAGQLGAGGIEAGQSLAQAPATLASYLRDRLHMISPMTEAALSLPFQLNPSAQMGQAAVNKIGPSEYKGEALSRGAIENIPQIAGGAKLATLLNPLKLTNRAVAEELKNTLLKNKAEYSRQYNDIWKSAANEGLGSDLKNAISPKDMTTLEEFTPERKLFGIKQFTDNPTVENAHKAKSDLLSVKRKLEAKTTLDEGEKAQYAAINKSIKNIEENMFKDSSGKINQELRDKYGEVSTGYRRDVIPYKENKMLGKYMQKYPKATASEVVQGSRGGEFGAQKGGAHPRIGINRTLAATTSPYGIASALAAYFYGKHGNY